MNNGLSEYEELTGSNQLELKALAELSGYDFRIEDYQRGYRWTPIEVKQLLNDFAEFVLRKKKEGEFYCLQPVVVRELSTGHFEVIDGQQRLTTLNLLLQYLSGVISILYPKFKLFELEYTTRPESRVFLANISHPTTDPETYIDFYFMSLAYQAIVEWFAEKNDDSLRNKIVTALLSVEKSEEDQRIDNANNIRIIWYKVAADENSSSVDIFTRLNIGKIPLTDAELVKALFLSSDNFSSHDSELRKINLSTEWNLIEKALRDESVWHFLNKSGNPLEYSSRIEFIFDILTGRTEKSPKYHTFHKIQEFISKEGAEKVWLKVKQTYNLLQEWYIDRELYHIIGYLLEQGVSVKELMEEWNKRSKSEFRDVYLREEVKKTLRAIKDISDLSYDDKKNVKKVLLLFNILTVLQKDNSDIRFPFDRFKTEKWDIEHVCSQTDRTLEKAGIPQWCEDVLQCFLGEYDKENPQKAIKEAGLERSEEKDLLEIASLRSMSKPDKDLAELLFRRFQRYFNEEDSKLRDKDNIANLALLDYATNRSYGNAYFPIKRKHIIANDSKGVFVPIATKNLFLKYYSPKVGNMMEWGEKDGNYYLTAIQELIGNYINPKKNNE